LRPLEGGKFVIDTGALAIGFSLAAPPAEAGDRLEVELSPLDAPVVGMVFGYRGPKDFFVLVASARNATVAHFDGRFTVLAQRRQLLATHHVLSLRLEAGAIVADVDGADPWRVPLARSPEGRWGPYSEEGAAIVDRFAVTR